MILRLNLSAIRRLMVEKRMTGAALANLTGISRQSISGILKRGTAKLENAGLIADALGVDVEYIWKED